jgi:hypothetical protein
MSYKHKTHKQAVAILSAIAKQKQLNSSPDILHHTFKNMTLHAVKWLFCNHY